MKSSNHGEKRENKYTPASGLPLISDLNIKDKDVVVSSWLELPKVSPAPLIRSILCVAATDNFGFFDDQQWRFLLYLIIYSSLIMAIDAILSTVY